MSLSAATFPPLTSGAPRRVPVHPGVYLDEHYLKPMGLTQSETARRLCVSRRRVHELVHGQRAMSADTALRCAQHFGLPVLEWLAMQNEWDAWCAWGIMRQQPVRAVEDRASDDAMTPQATEGLADR